MSNKRGAQGRSYIEHVSNPQLCSCMAAKTSTSVLHKTTHHAHVHYCFIFSEEEEKRKERMGLARVSWDQRSGEVRFEALEAQTYANQPSPPPPPPRIQTIEAARPWASSAWPGSPGAELNAGSPGSELRKLSAAASFSFYLSPSPWERLILVCHLVCQAQDAQMPVARPQHRGQSVVYRGDLC